MKAIIQRTENIPDISIKVPASKSLSHRALIAAALADGVSVIEGLADNDDIRATVNCLSLLGVKTERLGNTTRVTGIKKLTAYSGETADCGESGSTLRFLLPLFAQSGKTCRFTGSGKLLERPLEIYRALYENAGGSFAIKGGELRVRGKLSPGLFRIKGNVSSQFITGLLFLLPTLPKDSVIEIEPPFESASYVDLTLGILETAGITAGMLSAGADGPVRIMIPGRQKYKAFTYTVPADWGAAAFFAALSAIRKQKIQLLGVDINSPQGDRAIFKILSRMRAPIRSKRISPLKVRQREMLAKTEPDASKINKPLAAETYVLANKRNSELLHISQNVSDCPDLGPILFALASQAYGRSSISGTKRLKLKESDRVAAMTEELEKLGCLITPGKVRVYVDGPTEIRGGVTLSGHNDHRVVMSLAVLCSVAEKPVTIEGAEAVTKSYPDFFKDLAACGVGVELAEDMQ